MNERRARAAAVVRAHGLDADHFEAVTVAVARAGLAGADGPAFVAALGELGDQQIAAVLHTLEAEEAAPARRKAIRRALHRLRERGIAAPAVAVPAAAGVAPVRAAREREAWLSAVDGAGARLVWVAVAQPSGGWLAVTAELNEPGGLFDLRVSEMAKKQIRAMRRQLHERGFALVAAPFAAADALLVEGQQRRGAVDRKLDYLRVRPRLVTTPPDAAAEPRSPRVAAPSPDEVETLVAGSARLLEEPELAGWWPRGPEADPFLQEIGALEDSPIVLSRSQQESRLAALMARAGAALYPRPVVARRLRATAYVLGETGRVDAARTALAVAEAIERDPAGTGDVPLLATLVHQGLGRLAAARAAARREQRERALVLTPGEALTDRSAGRPPRTRS